MNFSQMPDFDDHEEVRVFDLSQTGAKAIIAVHSTHRGPAFGGCRVWRYDDLDAAVTDALRLSRGMSYKNAMADLPLGGGKAVIMAPAGEIDRRALFEAFGRAVDSLAGRYRTAEDVGSTVADMQIVATQTPYVGGLPATAAGRAGGDPSPWTALGVFAAIEAALAWKFGLPISRARVGIQGVGSVGADLARRLVEAGARVTVADIDSNRAQAVAAGLDVQVLDVGAIHKLEAWGRAQCTDHSAVGASNHLWSRQQSIGRRRGGPRPARAWRSVLPGLFGQCGWHHRYSRRSREPFQRGDRTERLEDRRAAHRHSRNSKAA
jgi:leucine dehydrogenase